MAQSCLVSAFNSYLVFENVSLYKIPLNKVCESFRFKIQTFNALTVFNA